MTFHDLRSFLAALERERDLMRVAAAVDPYLESTALCLRALRDDGPALLMERPRGSGHALLGNLFGHRRRIERALGGRPLASLRELGRLLALEAEAKAARRGLWSDAHAVPPWQWRERHPRVPSPAGAGAPA